jgi:hypothetical protein
VTLSGRSREGGEGGSNFTQTRQVLGDRLGQEAGGEEGCCAVPFEEKQGVEGTQGRRVLKGVRRCEQWGCGGATR